ncbi:gamma-aminobutyric acid type B receptor subunit 2-like [Gigantopelta aegis]|uniref:gamma-aminobutyric acid type B receptor subunit 2-like n=1 Tax=Gigantopelta aegis TaxID=1735272 RepID=UPI001B887FD2|nr:gamma-aminobutyric acid type B receptor subunit 2-like [Gigantopelta aegis]
MCVRKPLTFLLVLQVQTTLCGPVKDLNILALFPYKKYSDWEDPFLPGAQLFVDNVNKHPNILPGYRLKLEWNYTQCDPGETVKILVSRFCGDPKIIMVLGGFCSSVSKVVGLSVHLWNVIQISYGSTSVALSNKDKFPNFYRVVTSDTTYNFARVALMKYFKWNKVITLYDRTDDDFRLLIDDLEAVMDDVGIDVLENLVFDDDPTKNVHQLKKLDARIIVGVFNDVKAREIFCTAFKIKFFGPKIVWILPNFSKWLWWNNVYKSCAPDDIRVDFSNYFEVAPRVNFLPSRDDNGYTLEDFWVAYMKDNDNDNNRYMNLVWVFNIYKAIWTMARALNATIGDLRNKGYGLDAFSYTDSYNISKLIKHNVEKTNFSSIFGRVSFHSRGETRNMLNILQVQDGKMVNVGWYERHGTVETLTWNESGPVVWANGVVPKDSVTEDFITETVSPALYISMCVFATLGILLAIGLLVLNLKFKHLKVIKRSSPNINNIILVGCIVAYSFVFVHGITNRESVVICQLKSYLLVIGFSLVFGALFAKTWRVYAIFLASRKLRKRVLKDRDLYIKIGMFTSLNLFIMVVWSVIGPSRPKAILMHSRNVEDVVNDRILIPVKMTCESKYDTYFHIILLAIQAMFLMIGLFLAFSTRRVNITVMNDSKPIALCIYIVILLSIVGLPVSLIQNDNNPNVSFSVISILIIAGTTSTQCNIFFPKIDALHKFLRSEESESKSSQKTTAISQVGISTDSIQN